MERTDDESNKQPVILPPMIRIAYCTPSLHIPGGVERVLTTKANYLAENGNYDIYILLTSACGLAAVTCKIYLKRRRSAVILRDAFASAGCNVIFAA